MKLKKIRNALLVMLTLALVSASAVAVTLAYVPAKIDSATNTFANPNLDVKIGERKWDGEDYDGKGHYTPDGGSRTEYDGSSSKPIPSLPTDSVEMDTGTIPAEQLGVNQAKQYSEGATIPKNPSLKNNTSDVATLGSFTGDEWLAMTVDYRIKVYDNSTGQKKWLLYTIAETEGVKSATLVTSAPDGMSSLEDDEYYNLGARPNFVSAIANIGDGATTSAYQNKSFGLYSTVTEEAANGAGKWVSKDENDKVFYYTEKVENKDDTSTADIVENKTKTLFDWVRIKTFDSNDVVTARLYTNETQYTEETFYKLNDTNYYFKGLPEFDIVLKGYAVQADGVEWKDATQTTITPSGYPAVAALDALIAAN